MNRGPAHGQCEWMSGGVMVIAIIITEGWCLVWTIKHAQRKCGRFISCSTKRSPNWSLDTTEIYSLAILDDRTPESAPRCQRHWAWPRCPRALPSLEAVGGNALLVAAGLHCLWPRHSSASFISPSPLPNASNLPLSPLLRALDTG